MRKKCALHVVITVLSSSDRPTGLVPDLLPPEISGEDACLCQRHLVAVRRFQPGRDYSVVWADGGGHGHGAEYL